jgi:autotransporter-associated beta strand protein
LQSGANTTAGPPPTSGPFGTGTITINGGALDLNGKNVGNALSITGTGLSANGVIINSSTTAGEVSGAVAMTAASSIGGANPYTISGVISGGFAITKLGSNVVTFSGNNTYTGLTTIAAGTLKLGAPGTSTNTPLGTTGAGTSITAGATLDLNGYTLATAEALTLNGKGVSNNGALINSSVSTLATYSGAVTLGSASYIGGPGSLTIAGAIGSGSLAFVNSGTFDLSSTTNAITTIAASGATSITLKNNAALSIGTVDGISGMTFTGNVTLDTVGTITMNGFTIQKNGATDSTFTFRSTARVDLWNSSNQVIASSTVGTLSLIHI